MMFTVYLFWKIKIKISSSPFPINTYSKIKYINTVKKNKIVVGADT